MLLLIGLGLLGKAAAAGEYAATHRPYSSWEHGEVAEGIAFVLLVAVFVAIGAIAINHKRKKREAAASLITAEPTGPTNRKFETTAAELSQHSGRSPESPARIESVVPEHETATAVPTSALNSELAGTESSFSCTFLDGAETLLEESIEHGPALDKEVYKALKQWRPPRVKPRLTEESRRRISAMSIGLKQKKERLEVSV